MGSQAYFLPGTFASINSFGLLNNLISTVILEARYYCHLHFDRWKLRLKGVEWLVQVHTARKCLKWDSSPSLKTMFFPPLTLLLLSMKETAWVHVVLWATIFLPLLPPPPWWQVWSQQPSSSCHCTLPSAKSWQWVFYSLTKMVSAHCPQIHPAWANKKLSLSCDTRATRSQLGTGH